MNVPDCRLLRRRVLLLVLPLLAACGSSGETVPERGPTVLAASSLQEALDEAGAAWTAQGHSEPVLSFAATSALARQVEQGAPADLFFSADEEWMDTLAEQNLLRAGTRRDLLGNRLVLVSRRGGTVRGLEELGEGKLALADPDAVPAGKYARAALESLGLWQAVADNVVPAENVRAALALVGRGEAPLGIVYQSDVIAEPGVAIVGAFPERTHPRIVYPAALTVRARPEAKAVLDVIASAEARVVFVKHGFVAPGS